MAKYVDFDKIGSGGFGIVTKCKRDVDGKIFAKKKLYSQEEDAIKRFDREVRLISSLDHPNVVRVVAKHFDDNTCWYAREKYFSQPDQSTFIIEEYKIPQTFASKIFLRYEQANKPSLDTFAPYAFYCLHIKTFFLLALIYNLISTRRTNIIDLEYIYYLPFCMAFSSSDKFHQILVPHYIRDDQRFVPGPDLKADLTRLAQEWDVNFQKDMKAWDAKYGSGPPENTNSVVYKLWRELSPKWTPGKESGFSQNEPEKVKKLNEQMDEFNNAMLLQLLY
jgi:hypothetical protein